MRIQESKSRDIFFTDSERKEVTKKVKRLLKAGWFFQCGHIAENGLVEGDEEDAQKDANGETIEVIQICVYT